MLALEREPGGKGTDLGEPLRRVAEMARKRGLIVLLSDLLAPVQSLERPLARLAAAGHEIVVFQVLDPGEVDFGFQRAMLFHDLESQKDFYIDPAAVRADYLRRFESHRAAVEGVCRTLGLAFYRVATDQPLALALLDFLRARMRRGRVVRRRSQQALAP
jgi:uncharacterized protein (DUF58 family)